MDLNAVGLSNRVVLPYLSSDPSASSSTIAIYAKTDGMLYTVKNGSSSGTPFPTTAPKLYSAGVITPTGGPALTDLGGGSAKIDTCSVSLLTDSTGVGQFQEYTCSSSTIAFDDNCDDYVVISYNGGTPVYSRIPASSAAQITNSDVTAVFAVWRVGNTVHSCPTDSQGVGLANKIATLLYSTHTYERAGNSGLIISESSSRGVAVTGALVYSGVTPIAVSAFSTPTDTMTEVAHSAGVWTYTGSKTAYDNTYIDNGTTTVEIDNSKYAVRWFYRSIGDAKDLFYVLGTVSHNTVADAELELPPSSTPAILRKHCMLVGRAIIQKGATSGRMYTAFGISFVGSQVLTEVLSTQSTAVSANITADRVKFTGSTAGQTLTLPAGLSGTQLAIRNAASVSVSVARSSTDTIEGETTLTLNPGESVTLVYIGTDWTIF